MIGMNWKRRRSSCSGEEEGVRERLIQAGGGKAQTPRGCVAVLLVGGGGGGEAERVVVDVRALGQPCVRALLEMAEREFGYDQKGVLRIPCAADEFRRALAADAGAGSHRSRRR